MNNDLSVALKALLLERDQLQAEFDRINERMTLLTTGIDAVSRLIGGKSISVSEHLARIQSDTEKSTVGTKPPALHVLVFDVLRSGPKSAPQIAEALIAEGYKTTSKDFANVIGSNLRAFKDRFKRNDDGRWSLAESTEVAN